MNNTFINQNNLTQAIFSAGNQGFTQNLAGRVPNIQSVLNGNASLGSALNTINTIPGVGNALNSLSNNPLGALTQNSGLNLPGGLPSAGAGQLGQLFSNASGLASSGIPTSVTGVVQLASQIKTIACNLKIPNITAPDIQSLLKLNLTAVEKNIKDLLMHELQNLEDEILAEVDKLLNPFASLIKQVASFFDPNNIKKILASIVPDVNDLIKNTVKEFTSCNDGPGAKKNDLSGKDPTGTAPDAPAESVAPEGPSAGQSALDSGAASNPTATSTPNADSFLANSSGLKTTPAAGGTETDYNAKGDVVSSKSFDASGNTTSTTGPAPAPELFQLHLV